ncbi:diguanylate cyclase domain-containing protein [Pseudoalteromonas byunsanensis]|uniref:diguanylate cyclase n=1 Tax=Pseudoalteromonas byunsanensis TaxID=327939 RepID=A0A1S1N5S2_9GAMM|nr:diguanylate cyclase [Pseudoalteromonas byunsanensis]OHU93989.1 diguanylate cyclase response regulator [Pseudoalteromonas byunsanensis]
MHSNAQVLIVDSDPLNRVVLENTLSEDCRVALQDNCEDAIEFIATHKVDLIITDISLVDSQGVTFIQRLKNNSETYKIPVIIVSSSSSYSDEVKGLQMGAVDYITKPFSPLIVRARVKIHLVLKQKSDLLEELASIDGLTELPNRRLFDKHLADQWQSCRAAGNTLGVLLVDIDYFKAYNDMYGYGAGDECLIKVARSLKETVDSHQGFIARYDGVRFAVILPGHTMEQIEVLLYMMHDAIDKLLLPHKSSPICAHVSISTGIVLIEKEFSLGVAKCLQYANSALSQAHVNQERMVLLMR